MKRMLAALVLSLAISSLVIPSIFAQNSSAGETYRRQIQTLIEGFKNATTEDQRREIHSQIRQAREQYRAANPPKELSPAEIEARRQQLEEKLRKDPFQWEMYQLRQSMATINLEERENSYAKIQDLAAKHAAEEKAKLTPEQQAEAQVRQAKNVQMRSELEPLLGQLHAAKTTAERKNIHTQVLDILGKYR